MPGRSRTLQAHEGHSRIVYGHAGMPKPCSRAVSRRAREWHARRRNAGAVARVKIESGRGVEGAPRRVAPEPRTGACTADPSPEKPRTRRNNPL